MHKSPATLHGQSWYSSMSVMMPLSSYPNRALGSPVEVFVSVVVDIHHSAAHITDFAYRVSHPDIVVYGVLVGMYEERVKREALISLPGAVSEKVIFSLGLSYVAQLRVCSRGEHHGGLVCEEMISVIAFSVRLSSQCLQILFTCVEFADLQSVDADWISCAAAMNEQLATAAMMIAESLIRVFMMCVIN